jgi:site-specific DNA recombinase
VRTESAPRQEVEHQGSDDGTARDGRWARERTMSAARGTGTGTPARAVLCAPQEKLLRQDLFHEFCDELTREMNRLRMEHRASLSAAEREIERIEVRRKKLIEMVMDGVSPSEIRDEMNTNAVWREDLKARLATAEAPPPLLHPEMAGLYPKGRRTGSGPRAYRNRREASEALRDLIDAIVLTPDEGALRIELKGLAAMPSAAINAKRSPETGDLSLQVQMDAVARNQLNLEFPWAAA